MEIVKYCHPVLRWKSSPLPEVTDELRRTIDKMFDLMYEAKGIGLAANQVGLPYRFFIANATGDPAEEEEELVFINPVITKKFGGWKEGEEGCLSLPQLYGQVNRAQEVIVEAYDLDGQGFEIECDDLMARVIQHETDHLDGVLFIDRMSEIARREIQGNVREFEMAFRHDQKLGKYPSDEAIKKHLAEMVQTFEFPPIADDEPAADATDGASNEASA